MELNDYLQLLDGVLEDVKQMRATVGYNMPRQTKEEILSGIARSQRRLIQFGECTGLYNADL